MTAPQPPQMPPQPKADPIIGLDFAGCHIIRKIGAGAMGTVYLGHHPGLDKDMCVKLLAPELAKDERNIQFFLREARSTARLDHKNIVSVYNAGMEHGYHFFTMTYIEGVPLENIIKEKGKLGVNEALVIINGVLEGMKAAHEQSIIHRDIKPTNILVSKDGIPKIVDFGLARKIHEDKQLTIAGEMVGTAYYMSPEQGLGKKVDHRADLYSIGVTLFHMLTGKCPFDGKTSVEVIHKHIGEEPPSLFRVSPDIPVWLSDIVTRLMQKNPDDRFQSAQEVLNAIAARGSNPAASLKKPAPAMPAQPVIDLDQAPPSTTLKISGISGPLPPAVKITTVTPPPTSLKINPAHSAPAFKFDTAAPAIQPPAPQPPLGPAPQAPAPQGLQFESPAHGLQFESAAMQASAPQGLQFESPAQGLQFESAAQNIQAEPSSPQMPSPQTLQFEPTSAAAEQSAPAQPLHLGPPPEQPQIQPFESSTPAKVTTMRDMQSVLDARANPNIESTPVIPQTTLSSRIAPAATLPPELMPREKSLKEIIAPFTEAAAAITFTIVPVVSMFMAGIVCGAKLPHKNNFFDQAVGPWVGHIPDAQIIYFSAAALITLVSLYIVGRRTSILKDLALIFAVLAAYMAGVAAQGVTITARVAQVLGSADVLALSNFLPYAVGSYFLSGYFLAQDERVLSKIAGVLFAGITLACVYIITGPPATFPGTPDKKLLIEAGVAVVCAIYIVFQPRSIFTAMGHWILLFLASWFLWSYQAAPRTAYIEMTMHREDQEIIRKAEKELYELKISNPDLAAEYVMPEPKPEGSFHNEARAVALRFPLNKFAEEAGRIGSYFLIALMFSVMTIFIAVGQIILKRDS